MKVFIVVEGFDYEGYSQPNAVFDSYDKAVEYKTELLDENVDYADIFEMEVL